MNILGILIFIFSFQSESLFELQKNSSLDLIAADFQILARVTNAIALRKSALQGTVHVNQVIAEFFGIEPKNFVDIVAIDTAKAISLLEKISRGRDQLSNDSLTSTNELEVFNQSLSRIHDELQKKELSLKSIEENLKSKLTELGTDPTLLADDCDSLMNYVDKFTVLLNSTRGNHDDNDKKTDFNTLDLFLGISDDLIECYTYLASYDQRIKKLEVWAVMAEYDKVIEEAPKLPFLLKALKNYTLSLKHELEVTSSGWKKDEFLHGSLGEHIHLMYQAHIKYSEQITTPSRTLTGAFIEPTDKLKVFEDLDSTWFAKHIVRGANTQELKKSLEPFRKISKAVIALDNKWKLFRESGLPNDVHKALEGAFKNIKLIEDLVQNTGFTEPFETFVNSMNGIVDECVQKPDDDFEDKWNQFVQHEKIQTVLEKQLKSFKDQVDVSSGDTEFKNTTKYIACLNDVKENVPQTIQKDNTYNIVDKIASTFSECSENRISLVKFLELFVTFFKQRDILKRDQKTFLNHLNRKRTHDILRLEDVLSKSNVQDSIECLSLRNFPNSTSVDSVTSYLRRIAKIKFTLSKTISVFRKLGRQSNQYTVAGYEPPNLALSLKNSTLHAQTISECTRALLDLAAIRNRNRKKLVTVGSHFTDSIIAAMEEEKVSETVLKAPKSIDELLKQADKIEELAKDLRSQSLRNMSKVFWEVSKIDGFDQERQKIWNLRKQHDGDMKFRDVMSEWDTLIHTNLDFARYKRSLRSGFTTVSALDEYFGKIFRPAHEHSIPEDSKTGPETTLIIFFVSVVLFLFICFSLIIIQKQRKKAWES